MKRVIITENQYNAFLFEDVYINDTDNDKKTAHLTYQKNAHGQFRNIGNKKTTDLLKTDKMDVNDDSTYIVMLKGGIESYNITDIKGTEVMHFFKNYFESNQETKINIDGETLKLEMENKEFASFITQFVKKVENVIQHRIKEYKMENKDVNFTKVCIYPIPSSKKFNEGIANLLKNFQYCGIKQTVVADKELLTKDMKNLMLDDDFIQKNKEYYDDSFAENDDTKGTNINNVQNELNRKQGITNAQKEVELINQTNQIAQNIIDLWTKNKTSKSKKIKNSLKDLYDVYIKNINELYNKSSFNNTLTNKISKPKFDSIMSYDTTKPHINKNDEEFKKFIGIPQYEKTKMIGFIKPKTFQIKSIPNQIRMGMKNYYSPNHDVLEKQKELLEGAIVVVFDDNVSGGATLSDVCFQLKNMGIEYQVPITLGKMAVSYRQGMINLNKPKNDFNY